MKRIINYSALMLFIISSCGIKDHHPDAEAHAIPQVINQGKTILFPDVQSIEFYRTEPVLPNTVENGNSMPESHESKNGVITIAKYSIITVDSKNYVFVKRGNMHFERTQVTLGKETGDRVIVRTGLSSGDLIAVYGVEQLQKISFDY